MAEGWGEHSDDDDAVVGLCMGTAASSAGWCVAAVVAAAPPDAHSAGTAGILAREISELQRDKRGGSRKGRPGKRARLQCRWQEQYLGPSPLYSPFEFRQRFGVPLVVFHAMMRAVRGRLTVRADATGKPGMPAELAVLYTLRRCRTGLGSDQVLWWQPHWHFVKGG